MTRRIGNRRAAATPAASKTEKRASAPSSAARATGPAAAARAFATRMGNQAMLQLLSREPSGASPQRPVERMLGAGTPLGVGDVRIHTDAAAALSAQAMRARAYTYGQNIVFNRGEFNPETGAGQQLLQHELSHCARQSSPAHYQLAFQKQAATPAKFYDEVEDAIKSAQNSTIPDEFLPYLEALRDLSKAADEKREEAVIILTPRVVSFTPPGLAPYARSDEFVNELLTRIFLLGHESEANRLRAFFRRLARRPSQRNPRDTRFGPDIDLWKKVTSSTIAAAKFGNKTEAASSIDSLLQTMGFLVAEAKKVDPAELAEARKRIVDASSDIYTRPDTVDVYLAGLIGNIRELFVPIAHGVSVMMDAAIADLEADRGNAALKSAKDVTDKLWSAFSISVADESLLMLVVDATRSKVVRDKTQHVDYFDDSRAGKKRSITIEAFDRDQSHTDLSDKVYPIGHILETYRTQVKFLAELYDGGANRAAMGATPLKLESSDDFRKFLHEKVLELRKAGKNDEEILRAIFDFLSRYLEAFTTSTQYNIADVIDDDSENYNKRKYPRAITGQLIHDCGVYALRIAYMLSLVKADLKLRIRFIFLPVHVGLIITGDGLPVVVAHNSSIEIIDAASLKTRRAAWEAADPKKPINDDQFMGELAGSLFAQHVDMPFRLEDAPKIAPNDPHEKEKLQKYYETTLDKHLLVDVPKADIKQFELQYLRLNDKAKAAHNGATVPFWNVAARDLWIKWGPILKADLANVRRAQPKDLSSATAAYDKDAQSYLAALDAAFEPVKKAFEDLDKGRVEVSDTLEKNPGLTGPKATRGFGRRMPVSYQWEDELAAHKAAVKKTDDLQDPKKEERIEPPFATQGGKIKRPLHLVY